MNTNSTTPILTTARTQLLLLMQEVGYGRIEDLDVLDGDPVMDPPPTVKCIHQFGRDAALRSADNRHGLILKRKVQELLEVFDREGSLHIEELKIEDGLPVMMIVTKKGRA